MVDKVETGLSVAVFRDKLNEYIYSQTLEDLESVGKKRSHSWSYSNYI